MSRHPRRAVLASGMALEASPAALLSLGRAQVMVAACLVWFWDTILKERGWFRQPFPRLSTAVIYLFTVPRACPQCCDKRPLPRADVCSEGMQHVDAVWPAGYDGPHVAYHTVPRCCQS